MSGEASAKVGAMLSVMKDQYGNYVVQRALEVRQVAGGRSRRNMSLLRGLPLSAPPSL